MKFSFLVSLGLAAAVGATVSFAAERGASSAALEKALAAQSAAQKGRGALSAARSPGILTVSGNGHWGRHLVDDGEVPQLSPYDANGDQLPDGAYRYSYRQLDDISSGGFAQSSELQIKRGTASSKHLVTGSFEIRDGILIGN